MHELAIAAHLVQVVEQQAKKNGVERVLAVDLRIGENSHIVEDSLQFHFDHLTASEDHVAKGAALHFQRVPMTLHCPRCDVEYHPEGANFNCPSCQQPGNVVGVGDELIIESLEVAL